MEVQSERHDADNDRKQRLRWWKCQAIHLLRYTHETEHDGEYRMNRIEIIATVAAVAELAATSTAPLSVVGCPEGGMATIEPKAATTKNQGQVSEDDEELLCAFTSHSVRR